MAIPKLQCYLWSSSQCVLADGTKQKASCQAGETSQLRSLEAWNMSIQHLSIRQSSDIGQKPPLLVHVITASCCAGSHWLKRPFCLQLLMRQGVSHSVPVARTYKHNRLLTIPRRSLEYSDKQLQGYFLSMLLIIIALEFTRRPKSAAMSCYLLPGKDRV